MHWLKKSETLSEIKVFWNKMTYSWAKDSTKWLLDTASISIRLSIDDIMMGMTLFVLFGDNIKILSNVPARLDEDFVTASTVCFIFFIVELVMNTWSKSSITSLMPFRYGGYMLTFFWFLDVIAIASMFPDVPFVANPMGLAGVSTSLSSTSKLSKAGRVVRLVRLVRLVKLYKIASERRKKAKQEDEMMELVKSGQIKYEEVVKQRELYNTRQSRLGEQLSESTTRRVVVLVLIMVCVLPLLEVTVPNTGYYYSTNLLHQFNKDTAIPLAAKSLVVDTFISTMKQTPHGYTSLIRLAVSPLFPDYIVNDASSLDGIRPEALYNVNSVETVNSVTYVTTADFSFTWLEYSFALNAFLTTWFIALLLVIGSLVFTSDTQTMVITPIERMMNMVEAVARDPLQPLTFDHHKSGKVSSGDYETHLLETTIEKITGLLRVGFGEAGAGIISANLQTQDSTSHSAAVNPLLPGIRIYAVIGFCDIHHFEDINQLLTNDVLVFVNTIAEIVHSRVHYWGGQCNKNLGNAFVIIWRIGDELDVQLQSQGVNTKEKGGMTPKINTKALAAKVVDLRRVPGVDKLADHALVGYLKIIAEINRNVNVLAYRNEPRLTKSGKEPFKVTMGFGLHAGWAIEGAVGSIHKVDATYLSPHVNMAARLETSSRQYGVPILISQNAFDLFSADTQKLCRRCDVVTVKGSEVPIGIYTYDCLMEQQFPRTRMQTFDDEIGPVEACPEEEEAKARREAFYLKRGFDEVPAFDSDNEDNDEDADTTEYTGAMKDIKNIFFARNNLESSELFALDTDLQILRQHAQNEEFLTTFKNGVEEYLDGNWKVAKTLLEKTNALMKVLAPSLGGDGPSKTLLNYIEEFGPDAPAWWKGYRPLTAK